MNTAKGFTIIELIVVIAIIAILAAIVLVNVTQYINKAKDAAVVANIGAIQSGASACYSDSDATSGCNADYTAYSGGTATGYATSYGTAKTAITNQDAKTIVEDWAKDSFCFSIPLNVTGNWCIDSTGYAGNKTCTGSAGAMTCQ